MTNSGGLHVLPSGNGLNGLLKKLVLPTATVDDHRTNHRLAQTSGIPFTPSAPGSRPC